MKDTLAIEMAPFALGENVTEEGLLEASERLEREFLSKCDGYIGRILTRSADGSFVDILFWKSASKFEEALEHAHTSGACANYFGCMAPQDAVAGKGISIFQAVKQYGFAPSIGD
jgi:hypothetical protein